VLVKHICPQSGKVADLYGHRERVINTRHSQTHFRCEICNRAVPVHDNGTLYRHYVPMTGTGS
jgi:hypothetical protein